MKDYNLHPIGERPPDFITAMGQRNRIVDDNDSVQREIIDIKEDIVKAKAAIEFAKSKDRAICIRFALGGDEYYEYWVNDNDVILEALEKDIIAHEREIENLESPPLK